MELFKEHGFDHTTMEQIAEKADVAKGTLFNHYPNKSTILSYFGEQRASVIHGALSGRLGDVRGVRQKIIAIFELLAEMNEKDISHGMLVKLELLQRYASGGRENFSQIRSVVISLIEQGIREEEFRSGLEPGEAASLMMAIYLNATIDWVREGFQKSLREAYLQQLDIVFHGMNKQSASERSKRAVTDTVENRTANTGEAEN